MAEILVSAFQDISQLWLLSSVIFIKFWVGCVVLIDSHPTQNWSLPRERLMIAIFVLRVKTLPIQHCHTIRVLESSEAFLGREDTSPLGSWMCRKWTPLRCFKPNIIIKVLNFPQVVMDISSRSWGIERFMSLYSPQSSLKGVRQLKAIFFYLYINILKLRSHNCSVKWGIELYYKKK
jgi:hypothetical protein